jgi:molybdopterin molybdotransferase
MRLPDQAEKTCRASIDFDSALDLLLTESTPLGVERVLLERAGRRRLAAPVIAQIDAPRADVAAMDGYALRSAEIAAGRQQFTLVQTSFAGDSPTGSVPKGGAVRVTTGAALPADLDQVIVDEHVAVSGTHIAVTGPAAAKRHVRKRASDFREGEVLLPAGHMIDPRSLVVAAAADATDLAVFRQPRVACLASGNELTAPGTCQAGDQRIPDSVSDAVLLAARQWGGEPVRAHREMDDVSSLTSSASALLQEADVLVMIGGAARGERDLAKAGLAPLGLSLVFRDVRIKPGKPVWYGRIDAKHILGLPGNPTAAMTVARLFLAPLLERLTGGDGNAARKYERCRLASDLTMTSEREQFLCGSDHDGTVAVIERQSASMQSTLAQANRLVRIPAGSGRLSAGEHVQTLRF